MASIEKLLEQMRREPANMGFNELKKVCQTCFGKPRLAVLKSLGMQLSVAPENHAHA